MGEDTVRELEHTADIGFEIDASSLDDLFRLAARGLVSALGASADPDAAPAREEIELERPDLDRLIVEWLRELLHRSAADRLLPEVEAVRVEREPGEGRAPCSLAARVAWRPWADDPVREIKGVTYHDLRVESREAGWHARVVLDV